MSAKQFYDLFPHLQNEVRSLEMLKLCIIQIIVTLGIPFEAGSQRRRVISLFSGVLGLELGVSESGAQIIHIILAQFTFEQCNCQIFQN